MELVQQFKEASDEYKEASVRNKARIKDGKYPFMQRNKLLSKRLKDNQNMAQEEILAILYPSESDEEHSVNEDLEVMNDYSDLSSSDDEEQDDEKDDEFSKRDLASYKKEYDSLLSPGKAGHDYHPEWKHHVKIVRLGMVVCKEKLILNYECAAMKRGVDKQNAKRIAQKAWKQFMKEIWDDWMRYEQGFGAEFGDMNIFKDIVKEIWSENWNAKREVKRCKYKCIQCSKWEKMLMKCAGCYDGPRCCLICI